jgi:putative oxidoreductase
LPIRLVVGYGFLEHGYAKLARGPVLDRKGSRLNRPCMAGVGWLGVVVVVVGLLAW